MIRLITGVVFVCILASAQAQIPAGFHPRYCLYDLEDATTNGTQHAAHFVGSGAGGAQVPHEYSYYKDAEGNLQALCVTRQVENSTPEKTRNIGNKSFAGQKIKIVPNPAQDEISIEGAWQASVYFFDAFGRQVLFERLNTELKIDISGLPCGIYTVKIDHQGVIYSLPLLIQR